MSTNFQIGFASQKNSSKVLKPPGKVDPRESITSDGFNVSKSTLGGGSSDIFSNSDSAMTPRSIKNHMRSNIFAAPSPLKGGSTGDGRRHQADSSHNRLFGDSDRDLATPAKNRSKSNIPIGGDESDASLKHSNGNGYTNSSREHNGSENGKNGNSLSGETFKPSGENVAPSNHVVNKNRIPPGGFSSGLW